MPWKLLRLVGLLGWMLSLAACDTASINTGRPSSQPITGTVGVSATETSDDTGWQQIDQAMELRTMRMSVEATAADVTILRFDPNAYRVSVKYDVANAGSIREWFDALKPLAVVNGGYFDEQRRATALVVFDGIRRGESYNGFGGMVVINEQGRFELRSLRQQPYDPNENLQQAMQSAPMLIQPGGEVSQLDPDQDRSRRTVIARDIHGRILLLVSDMPAFTLPELARVLKNSDLELDAALNLDGGRSTGLYVKTPVDSVEINSMEKLPLVLTVERMRN
ncbi:MAG TPA: phosphodiester glycosidase family protein [Herpetosiphonaceae bacterium]